MIVLQVVYFFWIYFDDILREGESTGNSYDTHRLKIVASGLIITICIACQPAGLRTALRHDSDSFPAAQAIIRNNLDQPNTLLVTSDPTATMALLLFFQNIRSTYGPPPFGPAPQSFADFFLTRMRQHTPNLEENKPLVLKLAHEHPTQPVLVVAVEPTENMNFDDHDPAYHLIPIYQSPPSATKKGGELFQIYLLKPLPSP